MTWLIGLFVWILLCGAFVAGAVWCGHFHRIFGDDELDE